ncbi:MAG: rhodanese-like domain-containing protein [Chitinophagaceae bacterium]|nr:rhodanese-like domain-containing protein [Chitinophagaceae bacterium]
MKQQLLSLLLLLSFAACSQTTTTAYHNADNKAFAEQLEKENVVILDVRTPEEYKEGHIPQSVLLNYYDSDFETKIDALDKNKTYLVYCASGGRSSKASAMMSGKEFKEIYNLQGGFSKWNGAREK